MSDAATRARQLLDKATPDDHRELARAALEAALEVEP